MCACSGASVAKRRSSTGPTCGLCSAACRMEAKRDAALKSKTKRAGRHESRDQSDRRGRFVCDQCGKRRQATRRTKRFCSVKCRVAAHRGVPAQPPEPMTLEELDREIADNQSVLGAFKVIGCNDRAFLQRMIERALALQAERAKTRQRPGSGGSNRPDNPAAMPERPFKPILPDALRAAKPSPLPCAGLAQPAIRGAALEHFAAAMAELRLGRLGPHRQLHCSRAWLFEHPRR